MLVIALLTSDLHVFANHLAVFSLFSPRAAVLRRLSGLLLCIGFGVAFSPCLLRACLGGISIRSLVFLHLVVALKCLVTDLNPTHLSVCLSNTCHCLYASNRPVM